MNFHKDYTKEPYSFLVNYTTFSSDNPLQFRKNLLEMSISEKVKAINNTIKQNKASYDLDCQTATTSTLSSGNVIKCEFMTGNDVLVEKDLLGKLKH